MVASAGAVVAAAVVAAAEVAASVVTDVAADVAAVSVVAADVVISVQVWSGQVKSQVWSGKVNSQVWSGQVKPVMLQLKSGQVLQVKSPLPSAVTNVNNVNTTEITIVITNNFLNLFIIIPPDTRKSNTRFGICEKLAFLEASALFSASLFKEKRG